MALHRCLVSALGASALLGSACVKARPPATVELPRRDLALTFEAQVSNIPPGAKKLTLWLPIPRDERVQVLRSVSTDSRGAEIVQDSRGNPALMLVVDGPPAAASARLTAAVSRVEERGEGPLRSHPLGLTDLASEDRPERWLAGPEAGPEVGEIVAGLYPGAATDREKARAAFDYVLAHGTGSCLDLEGLFIALARAGGVPARLRVGFSLPPGPGQGTLSGWHCWAEWWSRQAGWAPVDLLEAREHPEKRESLFGTLDPDRVGISLGGSSAAESSPYPRAEVDGKPFPVDSSLTWAEKR